MKNPNTSSKSIAIVFVLFIADSILARVRYKRADAGKRGSTEITFFASQPVVVIKNAVIMSTVYEFIEPTAGGFA